MSQMFINFLNSAFLEFKEKIKAAAFFSLLFCFLPLCAIGQLDQEALADALAEKAVLSCEKELLKERFKLQKEAGEAAESALLPDLSGLSESHQASGAAIKILAVKALALNYIGETYLDGLDTGDMLEIVETGCAPLIRQMVSDPSIELGAVSMFLIDFSRQNQAAFFALEELGIDLEDIIEEFGEEPVESLPPSGDDDAPQIDIPQIGV